MKAINIVLGLKLQPESILFDDKKDVSKVSTLSNNKSNTLTFCTNKCISNLSNVKDCIVFIPKDIDTAAINNHNTYIKVDNVRIEFIKAMKLLYPVVPSPEVKVGKNVSIDASALAQV